MNDLIIFRRMLERAKIWHEVTDPSDEYYLKAHTMVRVTTGPDTNETRVAIEQNGYKGTSARWYFDKDGKLIATGAFE